MKYSISFSSEFKKDIKRALKQGKKLDELYNVIEILAEGKKLDKKYKDHNLSGNYKGYKECHIEPDFLLIYRVINEKLVLILFRVGSHSSLFKM